MSPAIATILVLAASAAILAYLTQVIVQRSNAPAWPKAPSSNQRYEGTPPTIEEIRAVIEAAQSRSFWSGLFTNFLFFVLGSVMTFFSDAIGAVITRLF